MKDFTASATHAESGQEESLGSLFPHLVYYGSRITEFRLDEHKGDRTARARARVELKDLL